MSKLWSGGAASLSSSRCGGDLSSPDGQQNHHGVSSSPSTIRNLLVHITGNRATWEYLGQHGALWQVTTEQACGMFGCDESPDSVDKLGRALIKSIKVLESTTNIDEVVAVNIDGLPNREFTGTGEGAAIFLLGEGRVTMPQEIYSMEGNSELGLAWMKKYPKYTAHNLEEEGVMFLTGATYYFVHRDHPALQLLISNEEMLGTQVHQEPDLQGGCWYRVEVETFLYSVRMLRDSVLQITPTTFNLATLTVRLSKPGGGSWLQLSPHLIDSLLPDEVRESEDAQHIQDMKKLAIKRYMGKPLFATLRLSVEYILPDTPASTGKEAPADGKPAASVQQGKLASASSS